MIVGLCSPGPEVVCFAGKLQTMVFTPPHTRFTHIRTKWQHIPYSGKFSRVAIFADVGF